MAVCTTIVRSHWHTLPYAAQRLAGGAHCMGKKCYMIVVCADKLYCILHSRTLWNRSLNHHVELDVIAKIYLDVTKHVENGGLDVERAC